MGNRKIYKFVIVIFWIAVWQLVSMQVGQPLLLASPAETFRCLIRILTMQESYRIILATTAKLAGGFLLSYFLAQALGYLAWRFPWLREGLAPLLSFLKSVPIASIIILCLAWFSAEGIAVFIAGFVAFPLIYFDTISALDDMDAGILEMLLIYRVGTWKRLRYIYFPVICDRMVQTAHIAVSMCIRAGVAAELIGVPAHSFGEMLYKAKIYLEIGDLFAWTAIIILVGHLCEKGLTGCIRVVNRFLHK